jgi:hypothetical protein
MTSNTPTRPREPYPLLAQQTWWHKPLIWGTFVALLYVLREFFLIGFLWPVGFRTKPGQNRREAVVHADEGCTR